MNSEATINILLEHNGYSQLEIFISNVVKNTSFAFKFIPRENIDLASPIYGALVSDRLTFIIYDDCQSMRVSGDFKQAIQLLKELDNVIDSNVVYFVGPAPRKSDAGSKFPRGIGSVEVARFLDNIFKSRDYTAALSAGA